MTTKKKKSNCRPSFRISEAGHLLATNGSSKAGSVLSKEGKREKTKRRSKGCLNGTGNTFRLTDKQKKKLPVKLQKASQVIASVKLYREFGLRTAWLDLDGHFGNSIEDSRYYVPDLNMAVPVGYNINPSGMNQTYIKSLKSNLEFLEEAILNSQIDCVVWAHGADSHEDDDMGSACSTKEWVECSRMFYNWVKQLNEKRGKSLPVTLTLFGGYREDDYTSVLELHVSDIVRCLHTLCGRNVEHYPDVRPNSFGRLL